MQCSEHVHAIKIPFQVELGPGKRLERFVYSYLIIDKVACLIDSGVSGSEKLIFDYLKKLGKGPGDIALLILTHSHPDHIGSAAAIQKASRCVVCAHPLEKDWIEDVALQEKERPVPGFKNFVSGSVEVERLLNDRDTVELGAMQLEVVHTPGHSKGSLSLLLREDNALFSGDAILLSGAMPIYEDSRACVGSIKKLRSIEALEVLFSSWDDPRKGGQAYGCMDESLGYFDRIRQAVQKVNRAHPDASPMEFGSLVLKDIGLHPGLANPLIVRSLEADRKLLARGK